MDPLSSPLAQLQSINESFKQAGPKDPMYTRIREALASLTSGAQNQNTEIKFQLKILIKNLDRMEDKRN